MRRVKVKSVELLKFNKYLVTPSCNHAFVNDTSVNKLKEVPDYINCARCNPPEKP